MAYTKHNFKNGDILHAEDQNQLEDYITLVEQQASTIHNKTIPYLGSDYVDGVSFAPKNKTHVYVTLRSRNMLTHKALQNSTNTTKPVSAAGFQLSSNNEFVCLTPDTTYNLLANHKYDLSAYYDAVSEQNKTDIVQSGAYGLFLFPAQYDPSTCTISNNRQLAIPNYANSYRSGNALLQVNTQFSSTFQYEKFYQYENNFQPGEHKLWCRIPRNTNGELIPIIVKKPMLHPEIGPFEPPSDEESYSTTAYIVGNDWLPLFYDSLNPLKQRYRHINLQIEPEEEIIIEG